MSYVRTWLLGMFAVTLVCAVLQLIILILLRYLQTSIALAIKRGDPTSDSLAYILSVCLPTDDMTMDKCSRPPLIGGTAPSAAPSFASALPPPSTSQTLQQAATTLAAVGQPNPTTGHVSPSNISAALGPDGLAELCRRVPAAAAPINNSARVPSLLPSRRSSAASVL